MANPGDGTLGSGLARELGETGYLHHLFKRIRRHERFLAVAAAVLVGLLRLLGATWRVRLEGPNPFAAGGPFIGALWHRNLLVAAVVFRARRIAVPVSRSRDGDLTANVLQRLGFAPPPRGSSSRGGTALLRQMIRTLQQGQVVAILPDGPRGPARSAKPGVVAVARATGTTIQPVGISGHPCIRFASWDRALLPLPFARVLVAYGEPLCVPKSTGAEALDGLRLELERELDRLTDQLDARLGLPLERGPVPQRT